MLCGVVVAPAVLANVEKQIVDRLCGVGVAPAVLAKDGARTVQVE
jgi:hypothetical protein